MQREEVYFSQAFTQHEPMETFTEHNSGVYRQSKQLFELASFMKIRKKWNDQVDNKP